MNHLYLSWTQFLWGRVFVTYAFYFTALFGGAESIGLLRLCAYRLGRRLGFDPRGLRPSRDPRQVFAEFLLETSWVIIDTYAGHRSSRAARALSSKVLDLPRFTINRTHLLTHVRDKSLTTVLTPLYLSLAPLQTLHTSRHC